MSVERLLLKSVSVERVFSPGTTAELFTSSPTSKLTTTADGAMACWAFQLGSLRGPDERLMSGPLMLSKAARILSVIMIRFSGAKFG